MDIDTKYKLLEKLIQTREDAVLDQVKAVLGGYDKDFWDTLDNETQNSILRGKDQSQKGQTRPHDEVMTALKSRFSKE
ncbi:MAG TPA: hypothetical protein PLM56_02175 [Cyclobacteriaceae bacterium]|jgi:hypothetical protein|nr:hypothetical protein [Cytophagales bacterium]HMR57486.1 hypothetical protein [Cyclobacteriaceae bacterium]HNT51242.1 hypothetical protein [Cyclobacteriaceae bacterium]HRE66032.1 hypothetical protein [Cyclobacteriaceae bacterium]HRF32278.1 hypothetical protein [Cyclobacteriaceae bacterium]